jgi:hypothetical protein
MTAMTARLVCKSLRNDGQWQPTTAWSDSAAPWLGATLTAADANPADPLNATNWPAQSREVFWAQAVAKTGADFGLGAPRAKL